jgi:predicted nucleic acid-binding protein
MSGNRRFVDAHIWLYADDDSAGANRDQADAGRADDVPGAIGIHQRAGISFRDSMIVHSATEMGRAVLYSEDLNAGQTQADAFSALTRPGGPGQPTTSIPAR